MAAIFDLHHHAQTVHWHFLRVPVADLVVAAAMLIVFVLAIVLPFPGARRRSGARR